MLAERTKHVASSPTMKVLAEAEKLRRQGVDVVDLGAGEPDFATPDHVKRAGHEAIDANYTKYTANQGAEDLREAICARYRTDYGVEYTTAETIVTAGGKQALYNSALALFGPGDEVITHSPGWPSLVEQIKLADATPVIVRAHAEDGFALHAEAFIAAMTPRTKGIVINSPCNPTGALILERDLAAIADEALRRGIWIVLDLCYEHLIYERVAHNLPRVLVERMRDRSVITGSASKAYAMTGWRCGWVLAPATVIAACNAIQSHSTSNACSISQRATLAALTGSQACVEAMLDEYRRRRDLLWERLTGEPRVQCVKPAGAFYLFPEIGGLLEATGIRTSGEFAQRLLDEVRVALTAGEAFDAPGYVRLSYATSLERLEEGAARIKRFVEAHHAR